VTITTEKLPGGIVGADLGGDQNMLVNLLCFVSIREGRIAPGINSDYGPDRIRARDISLANVLAHIFGSPLVLSLEKHVNTAYQCTKRLEEFFEAAIDGDWDKAAKSRDAINALEHEADDLKKEIRRHVPKRLFMRFPRQDLLELLLVQDKMANRAKDVSSMVLGRKMHIPDAIADDFLEFVRRNIDAAKQARKSVRELRMLFTSGSHDTQVSLVESLIDELDQIETDTDTRQADLQSALFVVESSLEPVNVIFLYWVIELTGEIADMAERVGHRLELLLSH